MFDLCQCKITQILSKYIVKHTKGLTKNIDLFFFFSENLTGRAAKMYAGSAKTRECNFSMEII